MNKNKILLTGSILLIGIAFFFFFKPSHTENNISYLTQKVIRGSIQSLVPATGTFEPTQKAEIRSDIDGRIKEILVDVNDAVSVGQTLIKLDDTIYRIQLKEAEAKLLKAKSQLDLNRMLFESDKELFKKNLISKQEYEESLSRYKSSLALLQEASTAVELAKANIEATSLKSPLNGIVLSKNAIVGQMVSAKEKTTPLMTVASDLKEMNLVAYVNEADISKIKTGDLVESRVSTYPDKIFRGKVSFISNNPKEESNIVTYKVISKIDNSDLLLKPGMTAEVNIITSRKENVLKVPTSAFRVTPIIKSQDIKKSGSRSDKHIWILDGKQLKRVRVTTGISNPEYTEIIEGDVTEGDKIVIGVIKKQSDSESPIALPQPKRF